MESLRVAALPDRYAGPILFEGEAAAEILYRQFVPHFLATPEVLLDNQQYRQLLPVDNESFVEKTGLRVLPEFLSLVDDPTVSAFGSNKLIGAHKPIAKAWPRAACRLWRTACWPVS